MNPSGDGPKTVEVGQRVCNNGPAKEPDQPLLPLDLLWTCTNLPEVIKAEANIGPAQAP